MHFGEPHSFFGSGFRRPDAKYVGRVTGRFALPKHVSASGVTIFACLTQSISVKETVISAPVRGEIGAPVAANFDHVGLVKGNISRLIHNGFAFEVDDKKTDINALGARIRWMKRRMASQVSDYRSHKRFIPRVPHATIMMPSGALIDGFIIDSSVSGVAISADARPDVGALLVIGNIVGKVVRYLDPGFAVQFVETVELENLEPRLTGSSD